MNNSKNIKKIGYMAENYNPEAIGKRILEAHAKIGISNILG